MDGVVLGNLVRQYEPERLFSGSGHSSDLVIDTIYTAKQRSMHCIGCGAFAIKPDQPVGYAL
ncbi:hypothetical protein TH468_03025 [Thalassospira sp. MCCC 1A03138]|nr:hypothetical protein TH468_03025 [Thalassospira sp. MCCC 1A03138]